MTNQLDAKSERLTSSRISSRMKKEAEDVSSTKDFTNQPSRPNMASHRQPSLKDCMDAYGSRSSHKTDLVAKSERLVSLRAASRVKKESDDVPSTKESTNQPMRPNMATHRQPSLKDCIDAYGSTTSYKTDLGEKSERLMPLRIASRIPPKTDTSDRPIRHGMASHRQPSLKDCSNAHVSKSSHSTLESRSAHNPKNRGMGSSSVHGCKSKPSFEKVLRKMDADDLMGNLSPTSVDGYHADSFLVEKSLQAEPFHDGNSSDKNVFQSVVDTLGIKVDQTSPKDRRKNLLKATSLIITRKSCSKHDNAAQLNTSLHDSSTTAKTEIPLSDGKPTMQDCMNAYFSPKRKTVRPKLQMNSTLQNSVVS